MPLSARRLPLTPAPTDTPATPWIARYHILADTMQYFGDWARAAEYEELAIAAEHKTALQQAARAAVTG